MIYGDFPLIPLILVITLHNRKTLFCVFLCFRGLPGLKLTWNFLGVNILPREAPGAQEVNEGGHEAQKRPSGKGPSPRHPVSFEGSDLRCHPSSSPDAHLDLKMPI
jgi:hypothetical protein